MNNFRFYNSGKRKIKVSIDSKQQTEPYTWGKLKSALNTGKSLFSNLKLSRFDFEIIPDGSAQRTNADFVLLGRQASLIATNSVGTDGSYKVPESHILGSWHNIDETIFDNYVLFVPGSEDVTFHVWVDAVA